MINEFTTLDRNNSVAEQPTHQTNQQLLETEAKRKRSESGKMLTHATPKMPLWLKLLIGTIILSFATFAVLALVFSTAAVALIPIVFGGLANIHNALAFAGIIAGGVLILGVSTTGIAALTAHASAKSVALSEQPTGLPTASPLSQLSNGSYLGSGDVGIDSDEASPTETTDEKPPFSKPPSVEDLHDGQTEITQTKTAGSLA